jgi:hypothetical protein
LHFGLGKASHAETVEILWPSGLKQIFQNVEANRFYLIEEVQDQLSPQQFVRKATALRPAGPKLP